MYRIDNPDAATSLPAPAPLGQPGYFTGGNPQSGLAATIVDADWLNAVQEELSHVIEQAGMTLSKTDRTQLFQAMQTIAGGQFLGTQRFIVPGGFNYTPNPLAKLFHIRMQGAGGGAGGVAASGTGQSSISCAGQSGHYGEAILTLAQLGTLPVPLLIGAGGVGGAGGGSQGGNGAQGGLTSFGSPAILQQPGAGYGLGGGLYSSSATVVGQGTNVANETNFLFVIPGIQAGGGSVIWNGSIFELGLASFGPGSEMSNGASGSGNAVGQNAGGFGGAGGGTASAPGQAGFKGGDGSGGAIFIDEFG